MRRSSRDFTEEATELNITAFLNLMVILIPFLLITAVFSRMTVLELTLPEPGAQGEEQEEVKLALQLVVRANHFDIQDANLGLIQRIDRIEVNDEWRVFGRMLMEIKSRFPEEQDITLLLEPGTSYKTMIQVMDHVRAISVAEAGDVVTYELFPNISIGDAPEIGSDLTDFRTETEVLNGGAS